MVVGERNRVNATWISILHHVSTLFIHVLCFVSVLYLVVALLHLWSSRLDALENPDAYEEILDDFVVTATEKNGETRLGLNMPILRGGFILHCCPQ